MLMISDTTKNDIDISKIILKEIVSTQDNQ